MKTAIYTIAKNEEQFVQRWYESAKEADHLLIVDTGSTDKTVEIAKSLGIRVVSIAVSPWRFDDARNTALSLLPLDIDMCISLDMDEIILDGWKAPLEAAWKQKITKPRYKHIWSWKANGEPGLEFAYDHIHSRHGYRWKHPVHETLYAYGDIEEKIDFVAGIETHHYPDLTKSRSQYLPLLEMSVKEDPQNDRNSYYYARELFFYKEFEKAIKEFKRYLALPSAKWEAEKSSALRYLAKCEPKMARQYLLEAVSISQHRRESRVDLAQLAYNDQDWDLCYNQSTQAIKIKEKPLDYLCEEFAWGSLPFELAAISAFNLQEYADAVKYNKIAIGLSPEDQRLKNNMSFYLDKIK